MIKLIDILTEALNQQQIVDMAKEFMNSESYNSNHDCKRSTFEFIKWAKKNKGFEPDALLLAPPKDIKKFPGKSGDGDSHIFAIIDGFGVDFTTNQFPGISEPLKITPESQIPSEYKKIGGYYTNFPDWFENGKTSIKTKFNNLPQWFRDGFEKEGFKPELNEMIKLTDIAKEILNEDRCKRIADRRYSKPSAYKSGAIVRCRKGNIWKGVKEELEQLDEKQKETLRTWFKRKGAAGKTGGWVDCNTCRKDKKTGRKKCKPCGRQKGEKRAKYPSCRPTPSQCGDPGKGKSWGKTK